jgi:hypothetical protein
MLKHDKCASFEEEIVRLKAKTLKCHLFLSNLLIKSDDLSQQNYTMSLAVEDDIKNFLNEILNDSSRE